jgi:hypothetical protein
MAIEQKEQSQDLLEFNKVEQSVLDTLKNFVKP